MKDTAELERLLPDPSGLIASAPNITAEDEVSKIALRRAKVRELMRMGYEAHQIVLVLQRGIKISTDKKIDVPISEWIVKNDMDFIRQEDASIDIDIPGKRAEILDKLRFLYNQAVREYLQAKGAVKNSFLNTSLAILGKITELEGLKQPELLDVNVNAEAKVAKFAAEVHQLGEEDRNALITTIRQILGKRQPEGTGNAGVPSEPPRVPAQTSDNEGVSGKPGVRKRTGSTKTSKQETSN
jgi:hypothetical protein